MVGGGLGGCAAALALASRGVSTILTEPTKWLGGQLTSQGVPPDEHPWIESFGRTARYAELKKRLRERFAAEPGVDLTKFDVKTGSPGNAWVSNFTIEPRLAAEVLAAWLGGYRRQLQILHFMQPYEADIQDDKIRGVGFRGLISGEETWIEAQYFLDASETGELLPLVGAEYRIGAEARSETAEPHAPETADPLAQQAITWCMALSHHPGEDWTIDRPDNYEFWRDFKPPNWPGKQLDWTYPDPRTMQLKRLEFDDWWAYRRVRFAGHFKVPTPEITIVNWPQNDLLIAEGDARELTKSLLYWMQTEAGFAGLKPNGEAMGTDDGLAMAPYIRESRRIVSLRTITEKDVSTELNPGQDRAPSHPDSIGVGAYRIDLHPTPTGDPYLDLSTLPFEIPMGALIPRRIKNLIAAGKCLGSTHITNGCLRLHPIEWNIGESAGLLAAFCLMDRSTPAQVCASPTRGSSYQASLLNDGIELAWPDVPLHPL